MIIIQVVISFTVEYAIKYIEKGIIPKFSACSDGINWFKEKNEWHDRGESYYPMVGDIIFFDWYDDNGNQDGTSDHVGIVTRTDIDFYHFGDEALDKLMLSDGIKCHEMIKEKLSYYAKTTKSKLVKPFINVG